LICGLCATAAGAQPEAYPLWDGEETIDVDALPEPEGMVHREIYRAVEGQYQFLHGLAIISYEGTLFASWANSPVDENSADEVMRAARSTDHGNTWSAPELIAPGIDGPELHSHGVFLIAPSGRLRAYAARYGIGAGKFPGLVTESWELNSASGRWEPRGVAIENARPVDAPQRLAGGGWVMGIFDRDLRPGVAWSEDDDASRWTTTPLAGESDVFGDTTIVQHADRLVAIVRNAPTAAVAESFDGGRTWSELAPSNFPMAPSKAFAGRLSTGQWYLASNIKDRNNLVLSVSRPQERSLHKAWIVRRGKSTPPRFPGRAKGRQWSYPYACEHDGKLYLAYSIGKEDAGLSIIPIASLQ
jgi:hypothetical protein